MHSNENFSAARFRIEARVSPRSIPARTRKALSTLGYSLAAPASEGLGRPDPPVLRIVDDHLLAEIPPDSQHPETPIVLLTTRRSAPCADPRVVGSAQRPARLDELFPLLQGELEGTPRRSPRSRVTLPARCIQADRRWLGAIVELSTTGCVVESEEWNAIIPLEPGSRMNLHFALPGSPRAEATGANPRGETILTARAECREHDAQHAALEFCDTSRELRERVADYVAATLSG